MRPPIEPEAEPLTEANVELIYEHTGERHLPACPFAIEYGQVSPNVCTCPHIVGVADSHDKLQATIDRLTRERNELERLNMDYAQRVTAAERTVRKQREALKWAMEFRKTFKTHYYNDDCDSGRIFDSLAAALAPNTEGEGT